MEIPIRKKNRMLSYDYSQNGAYYITICVKERKNLFWTVGATCGRPPISEYLSDIGIIVDKEIHKINAIYDNTVVIDKYVIMPNHIHFIVFLQNEGGRPQVAPTISRIIQQFKGQITKKLGCLIWQKSYYDHVIRNEEEYKEIWNYIDTNILSLELDTLYTGVQTI